jgi:hypothetical protein
VKALEHCEIVRFLCAELSFELLVSKDTFLDQELYGSFGHRQIAHNQLMRALAVLLGFSLAYAGCSARKPVEESAPPFVKTQTKFDYSEHEPYAKPGENGITGQAFLSQQGGSVVTCAGKRVLLLPATSYFREVFWHMIIARSEPEPLSNPYPSLKGMIRRTQCDAEGNFSFSEIPDGTWFILTQVNARTGGVLIAELNLSNRRATPVLLTDKHLVGR